MTDDTDAHRIGELFGEALVQYPDLGTLMLALSNGMTYRSYQWDRDEFAALLTAIVEHDVSTNPPSQELPDDWRETNE